MRKLARVVGVLVLLALADTPQVQSAALPAKPRPPAARVSLSLPEMVTQAVEKLDAMRSALSASFEELERARSSQDIQRLTCVNEALTAVKGLVRLAEQNYVSLRESSARGDGETAEHEFVKLSLANTKVSELAAQLRACGGPAVATETEGDPDLKVFTDGDTATSEQDPASWFSDSEVILQVPSSSSPFI